MSVKIKQNRNFAATVKKPLSLISCSLPPQGFRPEAKTRAGTLVTRAYIKDSTYSSNMQSLYHLLICSNRGREESVGNDDVSIVCARRYEMVRMT